MKNWYKVLSIFVLAIIFQGCGGGLVGNTGYETTYAPVETNLANAWDNFDKGGYSAAEQYFRAVLSQTHSEDQEVEANLGLGWAIIKQDGFTDEAVTALEKASTEVEAAIGLGAFSLVEADEEDMKKYLSKLETFGFADPQAVYSSEHDFGLTSAKVHALMALLYYYTGQEDKAQAHAQQAGVFNDPAADSTAVEEIVNWLVGQN